jgi:PHD/YefM family antitoxin component YafN of YafNO toxin-antitoxin module
VKQRTDETSYLLRSNKNATRLLKALASVKAGKGKRTTVRQLRKEFNLGADQ